MSDPILHKNMEETNFDQIKDLTSSDESSLVNSMRTKLSVEPRSSYLRKKRCKKRAKKVERRNIKERSREFIKTIIKLDGKCHVDKFSSPSYCSHSKIPILCIDCRMQNKELLKMVDYQTDKELYLKNLIDEIFTDGLD